MFFFGAATAQKVVRQNLLAAEQRLIEFSKRYGSRSGDSYRIEPFDTIIPSSSIPLSRQEEENEFIIHGIRVVNENINDSENTKQQFLSDYPIVILHGYMNSSLNFYRNWVGLSKYFPVVFSLDMLGWGLSSRPKFRPLLRNDTSGNDDKTNMVKATEDIFVESLEEWRQAQGMDKMVLAGHSMGGYLSVAYCERYPERVDRLILISPVGVPPTNANDVSTRRSFSFSIMFSLWNTLFHWNWTPGSILRKLSPEQGKRRVEGYVKARLPSLRETNDEKDALVDYLYYNSILDGSGEYALQKLLTPTLCAHHPLINRVPSLRQHVSFLYGSHDWMDVSAGVELQRICDGEPSISVYQVPNSGHLLMLDNWQSFDAAMALAMGASVSKVTSPIHGIQKLVPQIRKVESEASVLSDNTTNTASTQISTS